MRFDERPVNCVAKELLQMGDVVAGKAFAGCVEREVLPVPDPWHQLDRQ